MAWQGVKKIKLGQDITRFFDKRKAEKVGAQLTHASWQWQELRRLAACLAFCELRHVCLEQDEQIKAPQQQPVSDLTQDKHAKPQAGEHLPSQSMISSDFASSSLLFRIQPSTLIDRKIALFLCIA